MLYACLVLFKVDFTFKEVKQYRCKPINSENKPINGFKNNSGYGK